MSTGYETAPAGPAIEIFRGFQSYESAGPAVPPPPPPPPIPIVSNINPPSGTSLSVNQTISFNVTSGGGSGVLKLTMILAKYPQTGQYDVIFDGMTFAPNYSGTISTIVNGYAFSNIVRSGGWPSAPQILPVLVDNFGQENL